MLTFNLPQLFFSLPRNLSWNSSWTLENIHLLVRQGIIRGNARRVLLTGAIKVVKMDWHALFVIFADQAKDVDEKRRRGMFVTL